MTFLVSTRGGVDFDCKIESNDTLLDTWTDDNKVAISLLVSSWLVLLSDSPLASAVGRPRRVFVAFKKALLPDGVLSIVGKYSSLADLLIASLSVDPSRGSLKGPFLAEMRQTPVLPEYVYWLRTGDAKVLQYLLSFLYYGKKVEISDESLESSALRRWLSVEKRLENLRLPSWLDRLRVILATVFPHRLVSGFRPSFGKGKVSERGLTTPLEKASNLRFDRRLHRTFFLSNPFNKGRREIRLRGVSGVPGISRPVSETDKHVTRSRRPRKIIPARSSSLGVSQQNYEPLRIIGEKVGLDGKFARTAYRCSLARSYRFIFADSIRAESHSLGWNDGWSNSENHSIRVARLHFVPKTYKTYRSICMEPNAVMWAQQSVRHDLEISIRNSAYKHVVRLESQERNQSAASYGSVYGTVDTIDLSDASDSVSWELVKGIFPRWMLWYLNGTRTSRVLLPNGKVVHVRKFAPMGSAVCFPVQCIVYTTVCYLAYCLWKRGIDSPSGLALNDPILRPKSLSGFNRSFGTGGGNLEPLRVYGDDIACDARITPIVVGLLTELGFTVNKTKSFTGAQCYRESCGKHFVEGEDVTPLYFRLKETEDRLNVKFLTSLTALANRCGIYGYRNLRRFFIHVCKYHGTTGSAENPVRFTSDRNANMAIHTNDPGNQRLKRRRFVPHTYVEKEGVEPPTYVRYQRDEVRCWQASGGDLDKGKTALEVDVEVDEGAAKLEVYLYDQWVKQSEGRREIPVGQKGSARHRAVRSALVWGWMPDQ